MYNNKFNPFAEPAATEPLTAKQIKSLAEPNDNTFVLRRDKGCNNLAQQKLAICTHKHEEDSAFLIDSTGMYAECSVCGKVYRLPGDVSDLHLTNGGLSSLPYWEQYPLAKERLELFEKFQSCISFLGISKLAKKKFRKRSMQ